MLVLYLSERKQLPEENCSEQVLLILHRNLPLVSDLGFSSQETQIFSIHESGGIHTDL